MSIFPLKRPTFPLKRRKRIVSSLGITTVGLKSDGTWVTCGRPLLHSDLLTSDKNIIGVFAIEGEPIFLKSDGTCVAKGSSCTIINSWTDIVDISLSEYCVVGLKSNGTCVCAIYDMYADEDYYIKIQEKIRSWTKVVAINASALVGVKSDGTAVCALNNTNDYSFKLVNSHKDLIKVCNARGASIGLKSDGTCVVQTSARSRFIDVKYWTNIVDIEGAGNCVVGLKSDGTCVGIKGDDSDKLYVSQVQNWTDIVDISLSGYCVVGLKSDGTCVAIANHSLNYYGQDAVQAWKLATYDKNSLIISKTAINLLDKSKVKGFTINGIQPANTNRKVAFKVDNKWNKLTTEGALSPLPTQAITSDSVLAEGNTVAELTALTNVPALVGKLVYPAFALYANSNATVMPTIGMTVKAEIDTTVDVYTKTAYSQEFVLHNERDVLVKSISVDSNTKGNGKVTLKARYATFNETAITEEGAKQTEKWSGYVDLLSVVNKKCHKLQIKADYRVSITNGSDSATLNNVVITYAREVVAKVDGTTDLVTLTEKFTNDLTYVHAYIKHKELIDADLKAYVRLQKTPKKAEFKLIGYGTGARKTYKVTDRGINQDSLMVYVNGKAVYDFDFNTETSEITLVANVEVPINASYEYGWELFNYVEMQKGVSQINDSGAYTTEYSYTIPAHDGEYTVTAIKYELLRPKGKVTNKIIGIGTGKRQIILLPHYARKETISCNGKWSYDYDSKRLTVIAPANTNIVISYDWIAESPVVYGVMAGWAD